jgi:hypothetical protein
MKTIIPLLALIILASLEAQVGVLGQPVAISPTITPATTNLANINSLPVVTNSLAINKPGITNWPATNLPAARNVPATNLPPAIPDPPTGLHVEVAG